MCKEMTPLEALDELHCVAYGMKKYNENTIKAEKIVETALKNCEIDCKDFKLEETLVNLERHSKRYKGRKDDFDTLFNVIKGYQYQKKNIVSLMEENKTLKDKLKAFEIIKSKKVDISYLIICIEQDKKPLHFYNEDAKDLHNGELTQEEFVLLKEVLL